MRCWQILSQELLYEALWPQKVTAAFDWDIG